MANGSLRSIPRLPAAAAVVSLDMEAPTNTPCSQSRASYTSGTVVLRRPPNTMAEMGTPSGSLPRRVHDGALRGGHGEAAVGVCGVEAAVLHALGAQPRRQHLGWLCRSFPSHHTSPCGVMATLVKMVLACSVAIALGLLRMLVPGATPAELSMRGRRPVSDAWAE